MILLTIKRKDNVHVFAAEKIKNNRKHLWKKLMLYLIHLHVKTLKSTYIPSPINYWPNPYHDPKAAYSSNTVLL